MSTTNLKIFPIEDAMTVKASKLLILSKPYKRVNSKHEAEEDAVIKISKDP